MKAGNLPRWRVGLLVAVALLLGGCLEIQARIVLRQDGGGSLTLRYLAVKDLLFGKYAQVEKNDLLPLSEEEVRAWADRLGVQLVDLHVEERDDARFRRFGGARVIRYTVLFDDLEAFRFDHVQFAFYPWHGDQVFQFRVRKRMPKQIPKGATNVNMLAWGALTGRKFRMAVEFPARVTASNADEISWNRAVWSIPLNELVAGLQPEVVAWARMPAPPALRWRGWLMPIMAWVRDEPWRDPAELPPLLFDPRYTAGGGPG